MTPMTPRRMRSGLGAVLALGGVLMTQTGCELIAKVDRSQIPAGTGGGTTGDGGAGGMGQGGMGQGGEPGTGGMGQGGEPGTGGMGQGGDMGTGGMGQGGDMGTGGMGQGGMGPGTGGMGQGGDMGTGGMGQGGSGGGGNACTTPSDCPPSANQCQMPACNAGVCGLEPVTDFEQCDQGGGQFCFTGTCVQCIEGADCSSGICMANVCVAPACDDGLQNGDETDLDCGGGTCTPCADTLGCQVGEDCQSGVCCDAGACIGTCSAPSCTDGVQNGTEQGIDCGGTCPMMCAIGTTPTVSALDHGVAAQGGTLVITGTGFTGATSVLLAGVAQTFTVDSDTQITVTGVADATPVGAQQIVVANADGASTPFDLAVIRLQINEIDPDTAASDVAEFIEISTGVPNVSLAGYTLVFWNGSGDVAYFALELNATTDANGMLLVGNAGVVPAPALTWINDTLQNGPDAVSIHHALPTSFPPATPVSAAGLGLIDAIVYDTADPDDPGLLNGLISSNATAAERVQIDEAGSMASATVSIQRCGNGRRNGTKFALGAPTPGAANTVAGCP